MSVDKFGRYSGSKSKQIVRGPKGEGFNLTDSGDYDVKNKRLKFVSDPIDKKDAVNLDTLNSKIIKFDSEKINAQNRRIENLKDPSKDTDAVNLNTIKKKCMLSDVSVFDAKSKIIANVSNRSTHKDNDATNKKYVNDNFLKYDTESQQNIIDAKEHTLKNLSNPKDKQDAATKHYVDSQASGINLNRVQGIIDAQSNQIKNLSNPKDKQDAATKHYVDSQTPKQHQHYWDFFHKRLTNITVPSEAGDAVNLRYFQDNTLHIDKTNGTYDCNNYRLSSVAPPVNMSDAVNRKFFGEVMTDFSYAIYTKAQLQKGTRSRTMSKEEWKSKVFVSSWDEMFK